jgi:hypothetical protein
MPMFRAATTGIGMTKMVRSETTLKKHVTIFVAFTFMQPLGKPVLQDPDKGTHWRIAILEGIQ